MTRFCLLLIIILIPEKFYSQNLDIRILDAINSPNSLPSDKFFKFVSNTTIGVNLGVPAGMALCGLIKHDNETLKNACVFVAANAICGGITYALKYTVNRKRPFDAYPSLIKQKSDAGDPSFPSGHTSAAFATATSLSLVYPKWYVIVPSYAWASIVAYSRMHLGVHYPSDVLAGIINRCWYFISYF